MRQKIRCFALGCLLCSSTAWADPDDTLSFIVGAGVSRNDNIFRTIDATKVSDEIKSLTVGLKLDKEYSLQRFKVDAALTDYRYRDNSYMDYTGQKLRAAWLWKVTPSLYGNLSTSRTRSQISFTDYTAPSPDRRRNLRTADTTRFDFEWEALGALHLIGAATHYDQKNSELFIQDDNFSAKIGELGVKYVSSTHSSIALIQRRNDGSYTRGANAATGLDSSFTQDETEVRVVWNPTVKTNLVGRVAHIDRKSDDFAERSFSGSVGSLDLNWAVTDKLYLLLNVRRDLNAFQEARSAVSSYSSFYSANAYTISPVWNITEKTRMRLRWTKEDRDYHGTMVGNDPLRRDTLKYSGVGLEWDALRSLSVKLDYLRQSRDSNEAIRNFTSNIYYLSATLNF